MSQFGMQMSGGRMKRGSTPDVYTALAAAATVALAVACAVMFNAASKVGKDGSPIGLQTPHDIKFQPAAK